MVVCTKLGSSPVVVDYPFCYITFTKMAYLYTRSSKITHFEVSIVDPR